MRLPVVGWTKADHIVEFIRPALGQWFDVMDLAVRPSIRVNELWVEAFRDLTFEPRVHLGDGDYQGVSIKYPGLCATASRLTLFAFANL